MKMHGQIGYTGEYHGHPQQAGFSWAWRQDQRSPRLRGRGQWGSSLARQIPGLLAGALLMYLYDPVSGERRRHMARDRGLALLRRGLRRLGGTGHYTADRVQGLLHGIVTWLPLPGNHAEEEAITQRARQAMRQALPGVAERVGIKIESGQAILHGDISEQEARQLEEIVRQLDGIRQVRTMVRASG